MEKHKTIETHRISLTFEEALKAYNQFFVSIRDLMENPALSDAEYIQALSSIVARQGKLMRSFEEVYPPDQYPALYTKETQTKVRILRSLAQQINNAFEARTLERKRSRWLFGAVEKMIYTSVVKQREQTRRQIRRKRIFF